MRYSVIYVVFSAVLLTVTSCNSREKEARASLDNAKGLYERNELSAAKNEIDSLRARYPEEVKVLKETLELMRRVELKEAERNIAYCDSLLPIRQAEAAEAAEGFIFEKDSVYEETGHYIYARQTVERNVERTYVRCGVSETGGMYLASVYFGSQAINHTGIKVSTPDGLFAQTTVVPYDGALNYRFKDEGNSSEIVNYKGENGVEAIKFIYTNAGERIRVEYTGGKPYVIYMGEADKKAITATYKLAALLSDIQTLKVEQEKATKKKAYLEGKLNQ
jgi:hypothetical protein